MLFLDALIEELKDNCRPNPDITILIPFVVSELELDTCVDRIMDLWSIMWNKETLKTKELPFKLGVILEIPRAFLVASKIASRKEMQLICFDGGALTEFVFGMSYEDAGLYLVSPSKLGFIIMTTIMTILLFRINTWRKIYSRRILFILSTLMEFAIFCVMPNERFAIIMTTQR